MVCETLRLLGLACLETQLALEDESALFGEGARKRVARRKAALDDDLAEQLPTRALLRECVLELVGRDHASFDENLSKRMLRNRGRIHPGTIGIFGASLDGPRAP